MCVHKIILTKVNKYISESKNILKIVNQMKKSIHIIYIGIILLSACTLQNNIASKENKVIAVSAEADSLITSIIYPYKIGIDSVMNEVLCVSEMEMTKGKPESLLGNFVTDLCLEMYDSIADICVMNNGGLRSSLPSGKITRGDIYKLMPFENELVVLELNAEEVYELAEYITNRGGEPFSGCNIYSSGDSMVIQRLENSDIIHKNEFDNVTMSLIVCGTYSELMEDDLYTFKVLTSDYLANGGDKMKFFNNKEQYKVGIKLRDAIIYYCQSKDTISSNLDSRLILNNHDK